MEDNKDKLIALAEKLLEKEVIFRDDLEEIFGKSIFEAELIEEKKISKKADVIAEVEESIEIMDEKKPEISEDKSEETKA